MAGVTARVFGVLLLIFGIMLLLAGSAAFIAGSVDSQQYEEERNPFNRDQEREMAHDAAMTGGVIAAGVGFLVTILGVVLLVAQRDGAQQQQQVVLAESTGAHENVSAAKGPAMLAQQQRKPIVVGGAVAASFLVIVLAVLAAGLAGEGPAAPLVGDDGTFRQVGVDQGEGTIQAGKTAGVVVGNHYEEEFVAHPDADLVVVEAFWDTSNHEALTMRVEIDGTQQFQGSIRPGDELQFNVRGSQSVLVVLEPMPDTVVQDLDVEAYLAYYR